MRFVAEGPSIPDRLLEERDRGNVVFLCGAGVSMPAGLSSFAQLAKRVMDSLDAPLEAPSRRLFADGGDLDRVFNLLREEYAPDEVEGTVCRILSRTRPKSDAHSVVLRLSTDASHRPRLVTTNFDHLFERDRKLTTHVAPILPDLAITGSFEGIVYLHGRRSTGRHAVQRRLVLASADFGRAYLAEGWATRFVRDLLERYVIVLLGYSASDPPVRYLLEGLNSKRTASAATIYAFDHGGADEVLNRWRGRGVTALPYSRLPDVGHAPLWNSLRAWADRALDVDTWRKSIVRLARLGPANIASHERGQGASLVRTAEGAAVFARAADPPPAEWLCVFDRNVRCADFRNGRDEIDPLTLFGLDDDPSRAELDADRSANVKEPRGDDLIGMGPNDNRTDTDRKSTRLNSSHRT